MAILPNASEMTIENLLISYVEDRVDLTILFIYLFIFIILWKFKVKRTRKYSYN